MYNTINYADALEVKVPHLIDLQFCQDCCDRINTLPLVADTLGVQIRLWTDPFTSSAVLIDMGKVIASDDIPISVWDLGDACNYTAGEYRDARDASTMLYELWSMLDAAQTAIDARRRAREGAVA